MAGISFDDALALHQSGRIAEAKEIYRRVLREQPDHAGALHLLGVIHQQRDDSAAALELIGRAISLNPRKAVYHNNFGAALLSLGRYAEAVDSFHESLALSPNYADALANLALADTALGRESDAIANCRKALSIDPRHRDARRRLAVLLQGSSRSEEALALYGQAVIEQRPAEDLLELGNLFMSAGRCEPAAEHFRYLLARQPGNAKARFLLATACEAQYRSAEARQCFEQAARLQPGNRLWRLRAAVCAPAVWESAAEIDGYCRRLAEALEEWGMPSPPAPLPQTARVDEGADGTGTVPATLNEVVEAGAIPSIALAYQGRGQRRLKERFAAIYRDLFRDPSPAAGSGLGGRRRIGFIVTRHHEGLFLRCMGGILKHLERDRFEPWILCSREAAEKFRQAGLGQHVGVAHFGYSMREAVARIRETACDLIYYWEVGSDALNYFLPFARLAPVQCTGWGSTISSGVPAVDYFISSELIEGRTHHAERDEYVRQYTERLWLSKTLFMCEPRLPPVAAASAADFGLPDDRRLYVCFQNPLKIHPDADALFAGILAADPRGLIVLSGRQPEVVRLLKGRFARRMPSPPAPLPEGEGRLWPSPRPRPWVHGARHGACPLPSTGEERLVFLPPQSFENYCRLLQLGDVILDTPHYGAGSSCYDLFSFNLPVVTLPGELIVGRITQACYRKMGVEDLVLHSPEEYVSKAVQVATDRDYRRYVTGRIAQASDVLFNDLEAVREHERFFEEALSHAK